MPILRLRKHQSAFSDEDILINPSDVPGLKLSDVVELRPPKSVGRDSSSNDSRILLQVRKWPDGNQNYPNSVSIKESVATTHLKLYSDILVNIVDKKNFLVDSIEICFGNAYLARSYMWGLRNHLNNRCVYQHQKLDYLNIRSQICEIWAQGEKRTSGYVDDDTKIVFRSASSLVYLFIQMSSEMWDYDINGDLYCEKAINGFLTDLFEIWRQNDCSHDITIVLFSRTFYDAESLEEFPEEMRECLQVDYKGRYYEDCYRVAFQNDRFDLHDWNAKLTTLKSLFNQYQKEVINRHQEKYMTKIPRAYNSSAAQGNFLEVLNMSLNVFEKHYFDRSFDRTGQLSVVVSPGVGVFEVDFEMTNLTKQRIIDNGIGSDLVCLGEQPLHTVPLLKFNSKSNQIDDNLATCDVYNMPHWINLSFYSSQNQVYYSNFVPRIKLPTLHSSRLRSESSRSTIVDNSQSSKTSRSRNDSSSLVLDEPTACTQNKHTISNSRSPMASSQKNTSMNDVRQSRRTTNNGSNPSGGGGDGGGSQISNHHQAAIPDLVDYDDYDSQVFKSNSMVTYHFQHQASRGEHSILAYMVPNVDCYLSEVDDDYFLERGSRNKSANIQRRSSDVKNYQEYSRNMKRQASENLPIGQSRQSSNHYHNQIQSTFTRMSLVDSYITDIKIKPESADDLSVRGYNVHSSRINRASARPKALINPFDPSHMTIKLTPNRRRWTHVFPQGPTGTFIQQHHYQPIRVGQNESSPLPYLADVSPGQPAIPENEPLKLNNFRNSQMQLKRSNINGSKNIDSLSASRMSQTRNSAANTALNNARKKNSSSLASNPSSNKSTLVSNDTIRFAWCASGEQEWTPAITTGVDWKSLTMPACLPLTTDFFPSKTSLQNDYVIGEYNIDSTCIHKRYTLIEVYRELVCQRLQKGFQIILLPGQTNKQTAQQSVLQKSSSTSSSGLSSRPSSSLTTRDSTSLSKSPEEQEPERERTEYTMSIGRIFHKLTLNGNTITVTQYKPRHPYPTIKIDYCYRFRAPFHETYGQSWVHFKSEQLENYSWNYLDNYICNRGENQFALRSSLGFWRFRILILPNKNCLRKFPHFQTADSKKLPISDPPPGTMSVKGTGNEHPVRHDVYFQDFTNEEREALMESFIKLLEIINKTRRASASRASGSPFPSNSSKNVTNNNPATLPAVSSQVALTNAQSIAQEAALLQQQQRRAPLGRVFVQIGTSITCSDGLINVDSSTSLSSEDKTTLISEGNESDHCDDLHFESINMDIDSALSDAKRAEWVHVQYHNFYEISQAFELIIKWMVASGAGIAEMVQGWSRKVGNSSVHVVPCPWEPFAMPHSGKADPLRCPLVIKLHLDCLPNYQSLNDDHVLSIQQRILQLFGFIRFHDLISTENIEHQYVHMSGFAFVALPNLVAGNTQGATSEFTGHNLHSPPTTSATTDHKQPSMMTKINSDSGESRSALPIETVSKTRSGFKFIYQETISSPHEEYITRHIGGARQKRTHGLRGKNEQVEFILSWNYMLTKRWRSTATQDESCAVSLMLDLKSFCRNDNNRLIAFWNQIKSTI